MVAPKGTLNVKSALVRRVRDLLRDVEPPVRSTRIRRFDPVMVRRVTESRDDLLRLERRLDRFRELFGDGPTVAPSRGLEQTLVIVQTEAMEDLVSGCGESPTAGT